MSRLKNQDLEITPNDFTRAEWEHYYERAGIAEWDGGLSREAAEALALEEVLAARDKGTATPRTEALR